MIVLLHGIMLWAEVFFRFVKFHAFDGQTDRETELIKLGR